MRIKIYIALAALISLTISMTACLLGEDIETLEKKATADNLGVTVNIAAIQGVTVPAAVMTPVTNITETTQYTGTVTWSPNDPIFNFGTVYMAKITLKPKSGYTLHLVNANFFTVEGATATNSKSSGVITAVFPEINSKLEGAAVSAPKLDTVTHNSVTVIPVSAPATGQTVEYAKNTNNTAPETGWQTATTLSGLNAGTTYYIFARSASNNNYNAGAASNSLTVTTLQNISKDSIEYYWVDQHGSLVTTNNGAASITTGSTLIITALSPGYVVKNWYVNGVNTGETGNTYIFSITTTGKHTVDLFLEKDSKLYSTSITITVL